MDTDKKLSITQWAIEDRPREKLLYQGSMSLTTAELIAILLGSGNNTESAVDLAKRIYQSHNNDLASLFKTTIKELKQFKGIGEAKAVTIVASFELARRYNTAKEGKAPEAIRSSSDAHRVIAPVLTGLNHEEFWMISLSQSLKTIAKHKIGQGGIAATYVDIRLVLQKAILDNATSIIICHNHPSGTRSISNQDKAITLKIKTAANLVDIQLHDHIIITDDSYVSFADEGIL
ncbi:MAG: DNA repair protein RadC [Salinivirgaceae bacterium]|nr:DNA repair protein RadC [Salinivirgaceae bacterium]MDD4746086.1 DNA repair protein RadC [Salinivirgaceae bacterium]MDY0281099.1 DNA repair protein RadC [Salinivirgaceae bacterium]